MKSFIIKSACLWATVGLISYGCATMIPAAKAGLTALEVVGTFYDFVVSQKAIPETLQAATIILQQADKVATAAKVANTPELIAQAKLLANQANKL